MKTTALILLAFLMTSPAFSGDAIKGATAARKWCAECHDIACATTSDKVPGWRHIANDPQRTPETLRNFLIHPHGEMPQIALTQHQIGNLLAYIATLRK